MHLDQCLHVWEQPHFAEVLKREIEQRHAGRLPLQRGLSAGSYALDDKIEVMVISAVEEAGVIRVQAGIFYNGVLTGCSCADDPTPVEPQPEYCEVRFDIDKASGETTVTLLT